MKNINNMNKQNILKVLEDFTSDDMGIYKGSYGELADAICQIDLPQPSNDGKLKKCIITRYNKEITAPPFLTIKIDEVDVYEPNRNDLGSAFAGRLEIACAKKGYKFKFYTMWSGDDYDYELVVWNEDMSV